MNAHHLRDTVRTPVIVALDVESASQARTLVQTLGDAASFYKVGMELYAAAGMDFVRELRRSGFQVFLDLKLYDIPETVKRTVSQVAKVGPQFLTVHGVRQVMTAAVAGRGDSALQLLAVTVLTSFDEDDVRDLGYSCPLAELVRLRARKAIECGVDGMVSSARDVAGIRELAGPDAVLVTPGVRSVGASAGDQKRVATPAEALRNGADYVVIGRQVTRAPDPRAELLRILEEIGSPAPFTSHYKKS